MIDDLYRDLILDHYRSPRGAASLPGAIHRAEGQNPLCGDECSVAVDLVDGAVRAVEFRGRGCSISVASGSMMAEEIEGRSLDHVRALATAVRDLLHGRPVPPAVDIGDLEALGGVAKFPVRVKCALLAWTTLDEALARGAGERGPAAASPLEAGREKP